MVGGRGSKFIFLLVDIPFSQHHLLKTLFFPHQIVLLPLSKSIDHRCEGLFLGCQFYSFDLYVYPCALALWCPLCSPPPPN